jgi:predicted lipoprotein with Yx(FWY)xxD motif
MSVHNSITARRQNRRLKTGRAQKLMAIRLTNLMELNPSIKANSCSANQEIPRILRKQSFLQSSQATAMFSYKKQNKSNSQCSTTCQQIII